VLKAIDHVQIAIPVGGEAQARPFYGDLLDLTEVPKPAEMARRGGAWFESPGVKVHLGVEQDFRANVKAHVAFVVDDRMALAERAKAAGFTVTRQGDQIYIYDPFGNRLEFVAADTSTPSPWRGEGGPAERGRMGVGPVETQKLLGLAPDHRMQQRRDGATPNPDPSPLQGEGKRETVAPGGIARARRLRRDATFAERLLWAELRKLKANFRRQAPIGRYVADFVHHASKLIIEIDGPVHETLEAQQHDAARTAWLQQSGYRVIRFSDRDVADRLEFVVDRIAAEAVPPPSDPAPQGHLPPSRGKGEARYEVR